MRRSSWLAVCVCLLNVLPVAAERLQAGALSGGWTLSAIATIVNDQKGKETERLLRMGIRNESKGARFICITTTTYSVEHPKHSGGHTRGGMHSCKTPQSLRIVLAGETLFELIPTDPLDLTFEDADIDVAMVVYEMPFQVNQEARQTTLTWRGKTQDALATGRQLSK